jgi:hypothetical protein
MNHPRNVSVEEEVRVTTLLEEEYSMRYVANLIAKHHSSLIAWSDDLTRQDLTFEGQGKDENDVPIQEMSVFLAIRSEKQENHCNVLKN